MPGNAMSREELDRMARSRGFSSYAAMVAHHRNYRQGAGTAGREMSTRERAGRAWDDATAWHPANLFRTIGEALGLANDRNDRRNRR